MISTARYMSPLGELFLAQREGSIIGLWMSGQKHFPDSLLRVRTEAPDSPALISAKGWLDRYFSGGKPLINELSLAPEGSEFCTAVWDILCDIPYGEVTTYGDIVRKIADMRGLKHMSAQAVGGAVGRNPISIIIPCHRVIGSNASLTGYAGGLEKKVWLLGHEGVDTSKLFVPKTAAAP